MTVVVQTPFNQHTANGVTTLFGFTFQLLAEGDLQVSLDEVVQGSGYTISGLGVQAGGSITFSVAPANGVIVDIRRSIPLARSTDYQQNGDLPSDQIDEDYDRLWQALQDAEFNAGLAVQVPLGDTAAPVTIPTVAERASKFFAFDASGNAIAADTLGAGVVVSAFMETLLDDTTAADARTTLGAQAAGSYAVSGAIGASGLTMATARVLGRVTAATGAPEELTSAQLTANFVDAASDTAAGKVELLTSAEYATGTDTTRALTAAAARAENIVLVAAVSLSGLQTYDFPSLPSWAKEYTLTINALSTSGNDLVAVLIGDSGGVETTGYNGSIISVSGATAGSSNADGGLYLITSNSATVIHNGEVTIKRHETANNVWCMAANLGRSDAGGGTFGSKLKALTGTLDRVRISVAAGTFDAGTVALAYK